MQNCIEDDMKFLLKITNFKDFPPIFCLTAEFLPEGGATFL